ncbi:1,4-dihydroxy-6-naphthoate synthase [Flavisolibacter ginsenosidimutans]|uniref:1,4-dihydroxy-6-naphtoate synthase n=1 Tax=Flavisolibacter ginsenosidimutans TaxID=661481 RepID=A0A5B8UGQ9_9BACT|nr:1,4-dihydroxy-6-naphthoate synthase [Flavisolibacter ginsenosidimutans]QEC55827.1 1,4-dihydroxy-6-naphthoate synthase [Flavisolibacter ginsenosidimutans]
MKLTLGFSPCPNDTFIFDALVNKKIDTEGLEFEPVLEDVQTLNTWATQGKLDATKLSFPALFNNTNSYAILNAGSALGQGVGPLLIARGDVDVRNIETLRIAIPGENTTANFLLRYAFPQANNKVPLLFSSIEDAVCEGEVDLGVIIHENRFTYQKKGLHKVCDLGEIWEQRESLPIPLGCIAVKRSLPVDVQKKIDKLIKKSVAFAFSQGERLSPYVVEHAQAMEEDVMRKHIALYVNDYTADLGESGKKAIQKLHEVYLSREEKKEIKPLFVE